MSTKEIEHIIELALRAPSVTDRKPWKFRAVGNVIELYTAPATIESQRLRNVSGGALLHYLRLIIRNYGRQEVIQLFPRLDDPNLMAYIRMNGDYVPTVEEQHLYNIISGYKNPEECNAQWCKDRFNNSLRRVSTLTNAYLQHFNDLTAPETTAKLNRYVEAQKQQNSNALQKLAQEMKLNQHHCDAQVESICEFNNLSAGEGTIYCGSENIDPDSKSEYLLISTDVENSYSWLAAGEAMARTHLLLRQCGYFGMAVMPIIEDSGSRAWIAESLDVQGWPQIVMKLGKIKKSLDRPGINLNDYMLTARTSHNMGASA